MSRGKLFLGVGLIILFTAESWEHSVFLSNDLATFVRTFRRYSLTENDVVFVLDESGSIELENFQKVKEFTKLIAQMLTVSEDKSRVAVITFSTGFRIPINYIDDAYRKNMCILLKKIEQLGYAGFSTETDKAMAEAGNILGRGRPHSKKIIVLLTDGHSNPGNSPIKISRALRSSGIVIFAVGVAKINVDEINAVATSPSHIYVLKKFYNISKELIQYLHADTTDISMGLVEDDTLCNSLCTEKQNCCDVNAKCACGLSTGKYECACNPGYSGKGGYRTNCHKCPRGTYKSVLRNSECSPCPPNSTTYSEGSTDIRDCLCEPGYDKVGNDCMPVRCPQLTPPVGGDLIPTNCNNTYGSQCFFDCSVGYCPFTCSIDEVHKMSTRRLLLTGRTCLENKTWSGKEFYCESDNFFFNFFSDFALYMVM